MKKKSFLIALAIVNCFTIHPIYAKEPKNITIYKSALIKYHDSGAYEKDQAKVIDQAMQYLKTRLEREKQTNDTKNSDCIRH
jgi:hypothetical protein